MSRVTWGTRGAAEGFAWEAVRKARAPTGEILHQDSSREMSGVNCCSDWANQPGRSRTFVNQHN